MDYFLWIHKLQTINYLGKMWLVIWEHLVQFISSKKIKKKSRFFGQNFDLFLVKISIVFCAKFRFFAQNFNFLVKISICGQNYDFWSKFGFLVKILIFRQNNVLSKYLTNKFILLIIISNFFDQTFEQTFGPTFWQTFGQTFGHTFGHTFGQLLDKLLGTILG